MKEHLSSACWAALAVGGVLCFQMGGERRLADLGQIVWSMGRDADSRQEASPDSIRAKGYALGVMSANMECQQHIVLADRDLRLRRTFGMGLFVSGIGGLVCMAILNRPEKMAHVAPKDATLRKWSASDPWPPPDPPDHQV